MPKLLNSAINAWIGRRARPSLASIAAVGSLKPAVVVTGGSRGIGVALAREFARSGKPVALVARDLSGLEAAAGAIQHDYAVTVLAIEPRLGGEWLCLQRSGPRGASATWATVLTSILDISIKLS